MNTTRLILTTGPKADASHGDIVVLDWNRKQIIDSFRFKHTVYRQSHKGLAGASWHGKELLVATECELLEFTVNPLQLRAARSFPFLNDVHHLAAHNGRVWVCNTGLDCVEEFDAQWQVSRSCDLIHLPGRRGRYALRCMRDALLKWYESLRGWRPSYSHLSCGPFLRNTRKLLFTHAFRKKDYDWRFRFFRPHVLHPNHVLVLDGDVWITMGATGEIVSLETGKILANGLGRPHDGIVAGNEHYLTDCSTNRVLVHEFDPLGPSLGRLKAAKPVTRSLWDGFLRGIAVVEDRVYVGLTVRRGRPGTYYPRGRVVALRRTDLEPLEYWDVPDEFGNSVFSVLDATSVYN